MGNPAALQPMVGEPLTTSTTYASQSSWNRRLVLKNVAAIVLTFIVTFLVGMQGDHTTVPDSYNYRLIADGHTEQAVKPFANRILDAIVVRTLSAVTNFSPDALFPIVGAVALALFISTATLLFMLQGRANLTPWLCVALLCAPWLAMLFRQFYFPDLRHAALVAVFFLLMAFSPDWALPPLFLLLLTRESSILLSVSLICVYVVKGRYRRATAVAVVSALGILCQVSLASASRPNVHGISGLLYMLGKIPNNLAANIFGLKFIYNTYSYYATVHPIAVIDLPHWSFLHDLRQAALVEIDWRAPLQTLLAFLTAFGIAPMVLCLAVKRQVSTVRQVLSIPTEVLVALGYGVLSTVAAPFLGNDVPRYLSHAWPMFVVSGGYFVYRHIAERRRALFLCQICLCWLTSVTPLLPAIAIAISLQYWAFRISRAELPPQRLTCLG